MEIINCGIFTLSPYMEILPYDALMFCNCFNLIYNISSHICIYDKNKFNKVCDFNNTVMNDYLNCRNKQCVLIKEVSDDYCALTNEYNVTEIQNKTFAPSSSAPNSFMMWMALFLIFFFLLLSS